MCCCCQGECCCQGWHHYPGHYGPGWRYFQEPTPDERRAYLEEEKKALERRLKDVEARIAEMSR